MRMRKAGILVGILVCGVLAWGAPAPTDAQTGDPVGLIASAVIVPFWVGQGYFTVFEVTSLGENPAMHSFFFNTQCNRVFSVPFPMTAHDAAIVDSGDLGLSFNGLMALAKSTNAITAQALESAITLRAHRVNFLFDTISLVDAIGAAHAEDPTRTWNPLRSGASTITFPTTNLTSTRWWVVCPSAHVPVDLAQGIPPLPPGASRILFRVFDLEEEPLLDLQFTCTCLTEIQPAMLHPILNADARYVAMVSYIPGPGEEPLANPPSFVLYRELLMGPHGGFHGEDFGRAPGMSAPTLFTGTPVPLAR
jgi:hypothetical protein